VKIITASQMGLGFQNVFGPLGPERHVTGHHTAGPIDRDDRHAIALCRQYHRDHAVKGWGGIGYHFCITRNGTILCLRPLSLKGAHVGGWNSHNVGVMFHGTTGNKPTRKQARAYRWLLSNCHTRKMPAAHRSDRPLRRPYCRRWGHNDWPNHKSNACPGTHKRMILTSGARR
jgi:hypothetical protein